MATAACPEFTVEISDRFQVVRVIGTSIGARCAPETDTSPQMSIWTDPADTGSIAKALTDITQDLGEIVERRPIAIAGLEGEFVHCLDELKDWETNAKIPWRRMRVMAAGLSAGGRLHATAMCTNDDLPEVAAAFLRMLESFVVTATGTAATAARQAGDEEVDAMLQAAMARLDAAAKAVSAEAKASTDAGVAPPAADVETRFAAALRSAGLAALHGRVRPLATPALLLIEDGPDDPGATGLTRVGGGPDLAEDAIWPRDESGLHLNFLAQLDLAALPRDDAGFPALPADGLLSFFSGADLHDGLVLLTPAGTRLRRHDLPDDAEEIAVSAARMRVWSSDLGRFRLTATEADGLTGETEPDGRVRFLRDGAPVIALASEYEICATPQRLRIEPTLCVPAEDERYAAAGVDDPFALWRAIEDGMAVGDGPQHQMFGLQAFDMGAASPVGRAVAHARTAGWTELAAPDGWFTLLALRSGGGAGFEFWDHGGVVFMAHRDDLARGDVSRVVMLVESA
ncbi:hypothetical protein JOD31_000552 [Methylopila capsulata]|uniref:DUF1963 domain-containing protein n=1 Tax=Methylopila capsulata TaxID=61654 RepID=A0A9W6MRV0_9HYPH|nr:DUF1963 domain-containing protein [Methylopila capsulata]MBM7850340.1 hypothetical protein [Methylopila capsulata]GLK55633.1 hypothetical protein GCM10008170_16520 [Methylopila capsulata]